MAKTQTKSAKRKSAKSAVASEDLLAILVVDESSSMASTIGTTNLIEAVDDYIAGLRDDESGSAGKTLLSLTAFSSGPKPFRHLHVADPVAEVPSLAGRYAPNGMTALHDAIAHSLDAADKKLRDLGQQEMKVLHVTFSDGGENASLDYPRDGTGGNAALAALVQEYEFLTPDERLTLDQAAKADLVAERIAEDDPRGPWTFVYLGGGQESVAQAQAVAAAVGYQRGNTVAVAATAAGVNQTMSSLRSATNARKTSSERSSHAFFADAGQSSADYGHDEDAAEPEKAAAKVEKRSISDLTGKGKRR